MVLKRDHREADVEELAKKFREDWSEGEVIRSWLRRHSEELRNLVRKEDWSWANIGNAPASLRGIVSRVCLRRRGRRANGLRRCLVLSRAIPFPSAPDTPCHEERGDETNLLRVSLQNLPLEGGGRSPQAIGWGSILELIPTLTSPFQGEGNECRE